MPGVCRDALTWNIRDKHMVDTLQALDQHLQNGGIKRPKIVVWAHNSHLGDARATDMGKSCGEVNVGQLCRERFGKDQVRGTLKLVYMLVLLISFGGWPAPPGLYLMLYLLLKTRLISLSLVALHVMCQVVATSNHTYYPLILRHQHQQASSSYSCPCSSSLTVGLLLVGGNVFLDI